MTIVFFFFRGKQKIFEKIKKEKLKGYKIQQNSIQVKKNEKTMLGLS